MGFRFRKTISLGRGVRVNLGKNGISSVTVGKRGAPHVTIGQRGTYVGASIPGTGISYSQKVSGTKHASSKKTKKPDEPVEVVEADTSQMPAVASSSKHYEFSDSTSDSDAPGILPASDTGSAGPEIPTDSPSGRGHAKNPEQPKKWKRWATIIIVAFVALVIGNMSADPTQSNQYKELRAQLTSQQKRNDELQSQINKLNQDLDDVQDLKQQLEQQKTEQDSQQKELDKQKSEQEQKQQEQDKRQTQLDKREKNIAQREEAKKQAQEQQAAQVAQQQAQAQAQETAQSQAVQAQAPATSSVGTAHGGAFCSSAGATAQSDRSSSILTCRTASDGRLRWMR